MVLRAMPLERAPVLGFEVRRFKMSTEPVGAGGKSKNGKSPETRKEKRKNAPERAEARWATGATTTTITTTTTRGGGA
jgi:hypothetical protein